MSNLHINTIRKFKNGAGINLTDTVIATVRKLNTPTFSIAEVCLALQMQKTVEIWDKVDHSSRTYGKLVIGKNQIARTVKCQYGKLQANSIWFINPDNKAGKAIVKTQNEIKAFQVEHGE